MEQWKEIKGCEDKYMVSSFGRVKTLARTVKFKGNQVRHLTERIIKPQLSNCGYWIVTIQGKRELIHRLVAETFLDNKQIQVNHIDGNKLNNKLDNLEWCTRSENMIHAHKNNLVNVAIGERNGSAKTSTASVYAIREKIANGEIPSKVGIEFGLAKLTIRDMCNGKTWTHIDYLLDECKKQLSSRNKKRLS